MKRQNTFLKKLDCISYIWCFKKNNHLYCTFHSSVQTVLISKYLHRLHDPPFHAPVSSIILISKSWERRYKLLQYIMFSPVCHLNLLRKTKTSLKTNKHKKFWIQSGNCNTFFFLAWHWESLTKWLHNCHHKPRSKVGREV